MAADLVTLADAKNQLRVDDSADDAWLGAAITGVSRAVREWCANDEARLHELDGVTVRPNVVTAVLVEIAYQYANREGPQAAYVQDWYANGYPLSAGCTALLQSCHRPVIW